MSRKKDTKKSVGYGYVGRWSDGTLGWFLPTHLIDAPRRIQEPISSTALKFVNDGDQFFLCKITIEQIFKKNGRAITHKAKKERQ